MAYFVSDDIFEVDVGAIGSVGSQRVEDISGIDDHITIEAATAETAGEVVKGQHAEITVDYGTGDSHIGAHTQHTHADRIRDAGTVIIGFELEGQPRRFLPHLVPFFDQREPRFVGDDVGTAVTVNTIEERDQVTGAKIRAAAGIENRSPIGHDAPRHRDRITEAWRGIDGGVSPTPERIGQDRIGQT